MHCTNKKLLISILLLMPITFFAECAEVVPAANEGREYKKITPVSQEQESERYTEESLKYLEQIIEESNWYPLDVPKGNNSFKAQESFRVFRNPNTLQYKMQHCKEVWTDSDGFRRYGEEGYYMVALGSYYNQKCGTILRVTLENGQQFMVITGDQKSDLHTDAKHQCCKRTNSILEFIVDLNAVSPDARRSGDMSDAVNIDMRGSVVKIEKRIDMDT